MHQKLWISARTRHSKIKFNKAVFFLKFTVTNPYFYGNFFIARLLFKYNPLPTRPQPVFLFCFVRFLVENFNFLNFIFRISWFKKGSATSCQMYSFALLCSIYIFNCSILSLFRQMCICFLLAITIIVVLLYMIYGVLNLIQYMRKIVQHLKGKN